MSAVVVVGSVNADTSLHVARIPGPGETVLAHGSRTSPGGKGANQACAVARAGARSILVGAVGTDAPGAMLVDELGRRGVELDQLLRLPDVESGGATVLVDDAGENCIVVTGGANAALTPAQVTAGLAGADDVGLVLTQGELSVACVEAAAAWAAAHDVRFVHNLAPYRPATPELLALCDPLVVNEHEAADLATALGAGPEGTDALLALLAQHCRSVVITLGGDGAVHASTAGSGAQASARVEVVDTTGAGDAFVGAAAAALLTDDDLGRACAAGVAAGAAAVQHRGAQPEL
ncbi:ribokinase [Friedmanniella luteola]|uniref:Ribokinase n=1 Tax=Friedmanniella luteola TaxID=546871 RepID=A0A1H1RXC1_9ACTN|nr:ribokinase [Friedmanniella luteola]SDS40325.1 ribokinase [Friedmanniella luteola]